MTLSIGTRLGSYDITGVIGAGGMGEVYRARDTRLNRDVAVKVLPELVAADPERLARFEREAQTLAALNHPNIAQVYGLEESAGVRALVMELVDGEDLSQRIARAAIPIDDAIPIARQIADALEAAHEQGIIHRDLKPANIKVRPDGAVKVLDFGLAKAMGDEFTNPANLANSPTFSSPVAKTQIGVILGTAAYMAPEQARGKAVDKRADIWAFGCVLFEMIAGRRPFDGDNVTDTLASVVKDEPPWAALPAGTPRALGELIRRCLEKDPRQRLRDVGEARVMLSSPIAVAPPARVQQGALNALWLAALVVVAIVAAIAAYSVARFRAPAPAPLPRLMLSLPVHGTAQRDFAAVLSPDGQKIAYLTDDGVWLRRLSEDSATKLYDDELLGRVLFWSPDSAWIGLAEATALFKIPAEGGTPVRIADITGVPGPFSGFSGGAAWLTDGRIIFTTGFSGLIEVSASGGEPVTWSPTASSNEDLHGASALPDGSIVTAIHGGAAVDSIAVVHGASRTIVYHAAGQDFSPPVYSATGHLVFARNDQDGGVWALPFDAASLKATGAACLVQQRGAMPSVSADGRLLLTQTAGSVRSVQLKVMDRAGHATGVGAPIGTVLSLALPAISPDGHRVLNGAGREPPSVWLYDLSSSDATQLTTGEPALWGAWWPDGRRIFIVTGTTRCMSGDCFEIRDRSFDGSVDTPVAKGFGPDVSPDGKTLVFTKRGQTSEWDVATLRLGSTDAPQVFQGGPGWQFAPKFSPDGRFIAYVSSETGRDEVFVARYPSGGKWRITTGGGFWPKWRGDGQRLYFARGSTVFEVPIRLGDALSVGTPVPVLPAGTLGINGLGWPFSFDVTKDGERFVMQGFLEPPSSPSLLLMQNWTPR